MRVSLHTLFSFPIAPGAGGGGAGSGVRMCVLSYVLGPSEWPVAVRVLEASSWLRLC